MNMEEAINQARRSADQLIANLLKFHGLNYSAHREQLAVEIWHEGFWEGNDDITVDVEAEGLRTLRCIQEDHYDQHMDEDKDRPGWSRMIFSDPEYTWFADDVTPDPVEDEEDEEDETD